MSWNMVYLIAVLGVAGVYLAALAIERIAKSIDNVAQAIRTHSSSINSVAHEIHIHAETLNEIKHSGIGIDKKMTPGEKFVSDIMRGKKVR